MHQLNLILKQIQQLISICHRFQRFLFLRDFSFIFHWFGFPDRFDELHWKIFYWLTNEVKKQIARFYFDFHSQIPNHKSFSSNLQFKLWPWEFYKVVLTIIKKSLKLSQTHSTFTIKMNKSTIVAVREP